MNSLGVKTAFLAIILCMAFIAFAVIKNFNTKPDFSDGICKRCNVVLISIDSVRYDHLSIAGYSRDTTPHLRELAKTAWVFDNYFSTAYLTPISEGSVHTGLYPEANGVISFRNTFAPEVKPLAEVFKENGYRTFSAGTSSEFTGWESLKASFSRGFDSYNIAPYRIAKSRGPDWQVVEKALSDGKEPRFLWLALGEAHAPFGMQMENKFADPKYAGPFRDVIFYTNMQFYFDGLLYNIFAPDKKFFVTGWQNKDNDVHMITSQKLAGQKWPIQTAGQDMQYVIDQYDNGLFDIDQEIGRLFELLKKHNLDENTVVVIESEHGESLGEHGYIGHYDIFDEGVHVPLIISSPALKQKRVTELVSGVDIFPSLLSHVGVKIKHLKYAIDGRNFIGPMGEFVKPRNLVNLTRSPLWESILKTAGPDSPFDKFRVLDDQVHFKDHAVRTANAKLIHRTARLVEEQYSCWTFISGKKVERPEYEFYDLRSDPKELNPLGLETPMAVSLKEQLDIFEKQMQTTARNTPQVPLLQDYQ